MTDLRKAAEMALEALRLYVTMYPQMDKGYMVDARETLRQALAQPEQDWDLLAATQESLREHQARIQELEAQLAQPKQEFKYTPYGLRSDENGKLSIGEISQREWVGLTDEKIKGILDCGRGGLVDIKKAEQILKELNT